MARAALALGSHGAIKVSGQVQDDAGRWRSTDSKATRYRASTRYRDRQGNVSTIERIAPTKGQARAKLNRALSDVDAEAQLAETKLSRTTLYDAAQTWLSQIKRDPELSAQSKRLYLGTWERHIAKSDLASMPLSECNTVPVLRSHLQELADESGPGTAKAARSVLSGILTLAQTDGLVSINAVRGIRPVKAAAPKPSKRDTRRALTSGERQRLMEVADSHSKALALDLADLIAFQLGTGARIAEVLAVKWTDLDLANGTVHVRGTKSSHSNRVVAMPPKLTERLARRARTSKFVFPSPEQRKRDKPRDYSNVAHALREILDATGLEWATPHTLRRTAATLILEDGQSPTVAAAQLGHSDSSFTLRTYGAKRVEPSKQAAAALDW